MKSGIHPTVHRVQLACACGNSFETLSTKENVSTEVCSNCHPFYTGNERFLDTAQRLEKFEALVKKGQEKAGAVPHKSKKEKLANRKAKKTGGQKLDAKAALKAAKASLSEI